MRLAVLKERRAAHPAGHHDGPHRRGTHMFELNGRIALVTGAAGARVGTGEGIARQLARAGAHVVVADVMRPPTFVPEFKPVDDLLAAAVAYAQRERFAAWVRRLRGRREPRTS